MMMMKWEVGVSSGAVATRHIGAGSRPRGIFLGMQVQYTHEQAWSR